MNQYFIKITFVNGDEINANVAAQTEYDALQKLVNCDKVQQYRCEHGDIDSTEIQFVGVYNNSISDKERFHLQRSENRDGWWIAADKKTNVVMRFEQGNFNDTVDIVPLENQQAITLAKSTRELGDWLLEYHKELLFK